jgi:formyl-CoA transferase
MAERFLTAYGLDALLDDPRFATNEGRVTHADALNGAVATAIGERTLAENRAIIAAHRLTAVPVQTIADIEADPHWRARGLLTTASGPSGPVRMHQVVPRLAGTPGSITSAGGALGQDSRDFLARELELSDSELDRLEAAKVI